MRFSRITYSLLVLLVGLSSCRLLNEDEVVATVGKATLHASQLEAVTSGLTGEDSLRAAESYTEQWVRRQVRAREATRVFSGEIQEVERMVEEYRTSLLVSRLEQNYLSTRLDTLVSDSVVKAYYDEHREEFVMDRTIVKGRIVRLPDSYRQSVKLFNLMGKKGAEEQQDFLDLCEKNNLELYTFDSWVDFDEFLSYLPVRRGKSNEALLSKSKIHEMADADSKYFIEVSAVLKKGERAPYERVAETVRRMLYGRRRSELLQNFSDSLYSAAASEGVIEIVNQEKDEE
ncbi:MAG: hypothetical protein J6K24_00910 [Tidjanibacter sp.]|nr:hypothetical protein [Tidjanibacter sp.]